MSEVVGDILSREELDAIVSSFREGEEAPAGSPGRAAAPATNWRSSTLARSLREYADYHGRSLSTVHQRPISLELVSIESQPAGHFSGAMLDTDLPAVIEFLPRGVFGSVLVGRTLAYGWLAMAYGARAGTELYVPPRAYSPTETRFLRRCIEQLVANLGENLGVSPSPRVACSDLVEPSLLPDLTAPRLRVASFDAVGFGEPARLRIAVPEELCAEPAGRRSVGGEGQDREMAAKLLEIPIHLHAEIGWADIGLRALSKLEVGSVIEIDSRPGNEITVRLEDEAKFYAERGRSGERSAVRITEKL